MCSLFVNRELLLVSVSIGLYVMGDLCVQCCVCVNREMLYIMGDLCVQCCV